MPITSSAKKALRRDQRRTKMNRRVRKNLKTILKKIREDKTDKAIAMAYSGLDRAAKKRVIHKNKAARLKSRLTLWVQK